MFFESVVDWDSGKWIKGKKRSDVAEFVARPSPISITGTKINLIIRDLIRTGISDQGPVQNQLSTLSGGAINTINLRMGPAASGSAVIGEASIISKIKSINEDIKAADMESYGFYYAAKNTYVVQPEFACIKAAADFCNPAKGDEYHEACCYISSQIVVEICTKLWEFDSRPPLTGV